MKQLAAILLTLALILSMSACSCNNNSDSSANITEGTQAALSGTMEENVNKL